MLDLESRKIDIENLIATSTSDAKTGEPILQREALNKSIYDTEREFLMMLYDRGLTPDIGPAPDQAAVEGSAGPVPVDGKALLKHMPGDGKGGVIARDDYGDVPLAAQYDCHHGSRGDDRWRVTTRYSRRRSTR